MRLILMRHAKTESEHPSGHDHERRLTERGRADAQAAARLLLADGWAPDLVLLSDAVRTRQTWAEMEPVFAAPIARVDPDLYLAGGRTLLAAAVAGARAMPEAGCLMILAHNPGLKEAAYDLLAGKGPHAPQIRERLGMGLPTSWSCRFEAALPDLDGSLMVALSGPDRSD